MRGPSKEAKLRRVALSVTVDAPLHDRLSAFSAQHGVKPSQVVAKALDDFLRKYGH
jgi:hypothetical protein